MAWDTGTTVPSTSTLLFVGTPLRMRVAVAAAEHAEVRVVGVVLLHVDDDVLDLRKQVRSLGAPRVRAVTRATHPRAGAPVVVPPGPAAREGEARRGPEPEEELPAPYVVRHARATLIPIGPDPVGGRLRIHRGFAGQSPVGGY